MAKITLDVDEIKKELRRNIRSTAQTARSQITKFVKRTQKDFSQNQKEVLKKIDQVVDIVKSQEFMKNPKVKEITKKIIALSEQLEKTASNANDIVEQVKARVQRTKKPSSSGARRKKKTTEV